MALSITKFCAVTLDAPVVNQQWSWGSVSNDGLSVFLRCWMHETKKINGRQHVLVIDPASSGSSPGYNERQRHIEDFLLCGVRTYAIMIRKAADSWQVASYDDTRLFRLGTELVDIDGILYAPIIDVISPAMLKK